MIVSISYREQVSPETGSIQYYCWKILTGKRFPFLKLKLVFFVASHAIGKDLIFGKDTKFVRKFEGRGIEENDKPMQIAAMEKINVLM